MLLPCFKAYDIRGTYPETLNENIAYAVGRAFVTVMKAHNIAVGYDARLSGPALRDALICGLQDAGAAVTCLGMCGTEEIYYAAAKQGFDGGLMITGSHNPAADNGIKMVRAGAVPVSGDSGLNNIRDEAARLLDTGLQAPHRTPDYAVKSFRTEYLRFILALTGADKATRPLSIHVDAGNGCAGLVLKELMPMLSQ